MALMTIRQVKIRRYD